MGHEEAAGSLIEPTAENSWTKIRTNKIAQIETDPTVLIGTSHPLAQAPVNRRFAQSGARRMGFLQRRVSPKWVRASAPCWAEQ